MSSIPHTTGHRERLRARFLKAGDAALADYEILELILFRAIPRRDVKPLAKELLTRFGDLAGVAAATPERLMETRGVSVSAATEIKIVEAAAQRLAHKRVQGREVLSSWSAMMAYCRTRLARREQEAFHILFLDRKNVLIADETQQHGTIDHVAVYPREVVKRALELNASAVILAHNHPSGDPTPSRADIDMTKRIIAAGEPLGVKVHDHVVIGADGEVSFRALGLI